MDGIIVVGGLCSISITTMITYNYIDNILDDLINILL